MKLTNFLPLAAFASLATAVPASFSISVSLNEGSLSNPSHPHVDACLAICWPNQHQCAQGQVRAARRVVSLDTYDLMLIPHVFLVCLGNGCKFSASSLLLWSTANTVNRDSLTAELLELLYLLCCSSPTKGGRREVCHKPYCARQ